MAIENWQHDFNIGTIVRTANAFLAAEVHIVGNRRWNKRGAMVTDRYQHVRHHPDAASLAAYLHELPPESGGPVRLLGIDNLPGSLHLETMELPRRVCFLFGQEGPGLSESAREVCDGTFSIAQFGSTRSINASAAAAIAMHSWVQGVRRPRRRGRLAGLVVRAGPRRAKRPGKTPRDPGPLCPPLAGGSHEHKLGRSGRRCHTREGAVTLPQRWTGIRRGAAGRARPRAPPAHGCCGSSRCPR